MAERKGWVQDKVHDLLFGRDAASESVPRVAVDSGGDGDGHDADPVDFETRLERFFDSVDDGNRRISAGKLQIVDLRGVRASLGERWDRGRDIVHSVATSVIRRRLGPADVMARHSEDSYIVLFAQLAEDEARLKAKVMADEIGARLLGELDGPDAIDVRSVVAHVDGTIAFQELDGPALIERLMADAEARFAALSAPGGDAADDEPLDTRCDAVFSPCWFVPKRVVSASLCELTLLANDGAASRVPESAGHEALAHFALRKSVDRLSEVLDAGGVEIVLTPVHYATVANEHALHRFVETASKVPEPCRKLLCFEVVGVRHELAPAKFNAALATIGRHGRAVMCRVALDFAGARLLDRAAVHAIGVHLHNRTGADERLLDRLTAFARHAATHGLAAYCFGLGDRAQVLGAIEAGFTYIHGSPIRGERGGLARFDLGDLAAS